MGETEDVIAPSGSMAGIVRTTCLGSRRYTGDGHVLLTGDMVAHDSVPGLSRAASAMPLRLEESRFGDGFFDASGNDMYYIRDWQGNVAAVADGEGNVVQRTGYYPYGMPWRPVGAGSSNCVLFGGKEYHTADGLDEYDFGARRHYPRFPAFTTPDPHADNTPWLSPYVFCAANPVAYVDPSGMEFTTAAAIAAQGLLEEANRLMEETDETDLKAQYLATIKEIGEMRTSDQLFDVTRTSGEGNIGKTTYNVTTNAVEFSFPEGETLDYALVAHEFKHGHQFLIGEIDLSIGTEQRSDKPIFLDIYDEQDAYDRGWIFGGDKFSLQDIKKDNNYKYHKDYRVNSDNVTSFPSRQYDECPKVIDQRQKCSKRINRAFRINNITYHP